MAETVDVTIPVSAEAAAALRANTVVRERAGEALSHALGSAPGGLGDARLQRAIAEARRAAGLPDLSEDEAAERAAFAREVDRALRACQEAAVAAGITPELVEEELRAYNSERRDTG